MNILFVAAENAALAGAKVGGMADVVHELSVSLAGRGHDVTVLTPGYGFLSELPGFQPAGQVEAVFAGRSSRGDVFESREGDVRYCLIEHEDLAAGGEIYVHDNGPPFATDANRFALFCSLASAWVETSGAEVVHLHDWHVAPMLFLQKHDMYPEFANKKTVFTIHNLEMQGIRPLTGDASSLSSWFPDMPHDSLFIDPRWSDCVNFLRGGIHMADCVNTVSPTYANEIQTLEGGEGLDEDLRELAAAGRLFGILNGCEYPKPTPGHRRSSGELIKLAIQEGLEVVGEAETSMLVTGVGRLTAQKVSLLLELVDGKPVLQHLLCC